MSQSAPGPSSGSHYQPATWAVLVIVVLFVVSAFAMLRSHSPGGTASTTTTTAPTGSTTTTTTHAPTVVKSRVRVQVANGTTTPNLAGSFSQQLHTLGWDTLAAANATAKATKSTIYFTPGHLNAARIIASEVHLSFSAIQPLNGLNPVAGASSDDVILVLGPDLASRG